MKKINRYLNNIFFQKNATRVFSKIYIDMNTSKVYQKYCREVHSIDFSCWNTLSRNQLEFLENELYKLDLRNFLDIGSGNGELTKYLAQKHTSQATGIDFAVSPKSSKSINFIRDNFIEYNQLGTYDAIISVDSFYMINNYKKYFQKMLSHLTLGGKIIILFTYTLGEFKDSKIEKALLKLKLNFSLKDFTQDDLNFWNSSIELLNKLNQDFVNEGYFQLWNIKKKEADKNIALHNSNSTKRLALIIESQ